MSRPCETATIVGAGLVGRAWAIAFARGGWTVRLWDAAAGAADADLRVRFLLDGEEHWLEVRGGKLRRADTSAEPDLTVTGTARALFGYVRGKGLDELRVEGSAAARRTFARCFPVPAVEARSA